MPDVRYARSGDVAIAYQVIGMGPPDLVFVRAYASDLLSTWEQPLLVRHVLGMAEFARVLMLDKRGTGLSDRVREVQTLETRMDDLRAVMDDAGIERAAFFSGLSGAPLAILFAATYPERTDALLLLEPTVRGTRSADYPWAPTEDEWRRRLAELRDGWGRRDFFARLLEAWSPDAPRDDEFLDWFVTHLRRSLSPGAAVALFRTTMETDVSGVLPVVRVPTLVLHRDSEREPAEYVAQRIPDCELVALPNLRGVYTWVDDATHELVMRETSRFVAGLGHESEPERILATILFTDIVGSTRKAAELGDAGWRDLLGRHHAVVRGFLARHRGEELDTAGDGFFASFDGPGRAIACAREIRDGIRDLGLEIRVGVHTGECERVEGKLGGLAVSIGARVASEAEPGEVLVTGTVKDLVAGSGFSFEERGERELKGVPGSWRLYAVADG
ncbi:MAG TPA: adenylate/guanylate cyclase domain-containing protein [Gaiellaceae bacterium]|nr:adenylate/guanylate cyclase domain-containing protein [Gaiellaceae bacterium]